MRSFARIGTAAAATLVALAAGPAAPGSVASLPASARAGETVAVRAGTMHLVEGGSVLTGGATILMRDGRILAVGTDLEAPPGAREVDYGPDAVIVPGLVSANSGYGIGPPSERTADFAVRAIDNLDLYSQAFLPDLAAGVTTAYLPPARGRLVAGQGAVVKLGGDDESRRVLATSASIHGTIGPEARGVRGYWDPPVPATVDVGLGVAEPQLPRTTMGAIVALTELVAAARGGPDGGAYGPHAARDLKALMQKGTPWRMGADGPAEIRALLRFFEAHELPLVIDGCTHSAEVAPEIARAGAAVVLEVDFAPQSPGRDLGRGEDDPWPAYEDAAALVRAGVRLAIAVPDGARPRDLRFAAALASRGGLEPAAALRAITLGAAEALGAEDRVGSLTPGKDADFAVLNGAPLAAGSSVLATWIDGELAWKRDGETDATVFEVEELHVGDGRVLRPGQVLVRKGRIAEVGERVGHPLGAVVVRGKVAMPGMVDALGHLGLEGSSKTPGPDFKWSRTVEPGDRSDRRVARAGVTTVVLAPRGTSNAGTPFMAYKPAGTDVGRMVVADPNALRLPWSDRNRSESGKNARELLDKAVEYDKKWKEYEAALAKWTPPAAKPSPEPKEEKKEDGKKEEKKDGDKDKKEEGKDADKKDGEKKDDKKDKKKDKAEEEADPVTGLWEGKVVLPPATEPSDLRLRMELSGKTVGGSLRCTAVSEGLVVLTGTWEGGKVLLAGLGSRGFVRLEGTPKEGKLAGTLAVGAREAALEAERKQKELEQAARPEMRRVKPEEPKDPKEKPKPPSVDPKLEPLRRAMRGETAVVVDVDRRDELLDCVAAFEKAGIKPVIVGTEETGRALGEIRGRIAGVLLSHRVFSTDPREGLRGQRNLHTELSDAGVPVAFYSDSEEGASELAVIAAYAVAQGMSPTDALRAVTSDAARIMAIEERVGRLEEGLDGDVLLLDGPPLEPATRVLRAWVDGEEVR